MKQVTSVSIASMRTLLQLHSMWRTFVTQICGFAASAVLGLCDCVI